MRKKSLGVFLFLAIAGMALSFPGPSLASDLVMIGNRSVPVSELSQEDIQNIYLGKKKNWDNGMKIMVATLVDGAVTDKFLKDYVKKNSNTFDTYWKKQIFTGGGKPPVKFDKEKDLVEYVSSNKGALGYVSSQSVSENVKIILVSGQ
jgi:ABC-type phosphate transport system substrate-binding protein